VRIKEQETHLTLQEHDDDDDDKSKILPTWLELKPQLHYKFKLKAISLYYLSYTYIYVVEGGMKKI